MWRRMWLERKESKKVSQNKDAEEPAETHHTSCNNQARDAHKEEGLERQSKNKHERCAGVRQK